ncbi:hypothetical protein AS9A_3278 [Hoyosella subflava DQS3-9A1]|uniref:Uncharacterized protein n=1 Tax=Hoyosella subflava (strain DSM 45089 / JCM 17490 / NBRC 109087 / DQS3-9A1) TaxID=443218 RepID=F6EP61_HOYSD|nr:hypothetical protein AS9A_3278 [Hoyosella subflava DQS3-9A1]
MGSSARRRTPARISSNADDLHLHVPIVREDIGDTIGLVRGGHEPGFGPRLARFETGEFFPGSC